MMHEKTKMATKRGRPPKSKESPSRARLSMDDADKFFNLRLTTSELEKLNKLAQMRRDGVKESAYPLLLLYLRDCAKPDDRGVVISPDKTMADEGKYWGTPEEIINFRELPAQFEKANGRPRPLGTADSNRGCA